MALVPPEAVLPESSLPPLLSKDAAFSSPGVGKVSDLESQLAPRSEPEGDFDIECTDISIDGVHEALGGQFKNEYFDQSHLNQLIDGSPSGKLRLIIAQRVPCSPSHGNFNLEELLFHDTPLLQAFNQENFDFDKLMWSDHDPALFRQFLHFSSGHKFCAFYDYFEHWGKLKKNQTPSNAKISILWVPKSPEYLTGIILIAGSHTPGLESAIRHYGRWIYNQRYVSATLYGDGTLRTLGRLAMIDFLIFLTSKWIQGFRRMKEDIQDSGFPTNRDGLPVMEDFGLPTSCLTEKCRILLESLDMTTELKFCRDGAKPLDSIAEDLLARCDHLSKVALQLQTLHNTTYQKQVTHSNLRESRNVKRLSLLAAIFLPLSLGTGILSMQNRFKDVHLILWDWLAVCIDIGVFAMTIFWVTDPSKLPRLLILIKTFVRNPIRDEGSISRPELKWRVFRRVFWVLAAPLIIVIVVTFNFGMFGDSQMAWRLLGYGIAAGASFLIAGGVLYAAVMFVWSIFDSIDKIDLP